MRTLSKIDHADGLERSRRVATQMGPGGYLAHSALVLVGGPLVGATTFSFRKNSALTWCSNTYKTTQTSEVLAREGSIDVYVYSA